MADLSTDEMNNVFIRAAETVSQGVSELVVHPAPITLTEGCEYICRNMKQSLNPDQDVLGTACEDIIERNRSFHIRSTRADRNVGNAFIRTDQEADKIKEVLLEFLIAGNCLKDQVDFSTPGTEPYVDRTVLRESKGPPDIVDLTRSIKPLYRLSDLTLQLNFYAEINLCNLVKGFEEVKEDPSYGELYSKLTASCASGERKCLYAHVFPAMKTVSPVGRVAMPASVADILTWGPSASVMDHRKLYYQSLENLYATQSQQKQQQQHIHPRNEVNLCIVCLLYKAHNTVFIGKDDGINDTGSVAAEEDFVLFDTDCAADLGYISYCSPDYYDHKLPMNNKGGKKGTQLGDELLNFDTHYDVIEFTSAGITTKEVVMKELEKPRDPYIVDIMTEILADEHLEPLLAKLNLTSPNSHRGN